MVIEVNQQGLSDWQNHLTPLRNAYRHDINVGFSVDGNAAGWAHVPGYTSVNSIHASSAFKHEMGHNVGGSHCHPGTGDNYKYGYNAGDGITTNLCGNQVPYYSTPAVTLDGKVLGNAQTADMARLWSEERGRLGGYSAFDGERLVYTSNRPEGQLTMSSDIAKRHVGVVALSPEVGPTTLVYGGPGITTLTVKLMSQQAGERPVNFRVKRQMGGCPTSTTMNSYQVCHPDAGGNMTLTLSFHPEDNPEMGPNWHNGVIRLKALDWKDPNWSRDILVSVAVLKPWNAGSQARVER